MAQTFTAQVQAFADKAKAKAEAVVKQSAQEVFEIAQTPVAQGGNMPVDTGFLRNEMFVAGLNGTITAKGTGNAYELVIAGMELGDTMFGGWAAKYARPVEYGARGLPGRFFALNAARQWQAIVAKNAALVKG